jgi:hypothetical protein
VKELRATVAAWWANTAWPRIRFEVKDYIERVAAEPMAHAITAAIVSLVAWLWP